MCSFPCAEVLCLGLSVCRGPSGVTWFLGAAWVNTQSCCSALCMSAMLCWCVRLQQCAVLRPNASTRMLQVNKCSWEHWVGLEGMAPSPWPLWGWRRCGGERGSRDFLASHSSKHDVNTAAIFGCLLGRVGTRLLCLCGSLAPSRGVPHCAWCHVRCLRWGTVCGCALEARDAPLHLPACCSPGCPEGCVLSQLSDTACCCCFICVPEGCSRVWRPRSVGCCANAD